MSDRATWKGKVLSLMIVSMIALGGATVLLGAFSAPARAATCNQGGGIITANWTIDTTQVCSGILYTVDGSITINSGGSLTLVSGGLSFLKDATHTWPTLTVNSGGALVLDNSIVTTQTKTIDPYLKLAMVVTGGSLTMKNGAMLKFPGWFNATGATISMTDSAITGFLPGELSGTGLYTSDNDNSPLIAWSGTTATLYQSQIARIYENTSAAGATNVTGPIEGNVSLTSSSNLYAYDSYIGVDYSNVFGLHNELQVSGGSNAYLYNVTIDQSETPTSQSVWQPAYMPLDSTSNLYLLRWLHLTVVDSTDFPVSGATVWSVQSPAATTAQYPDNSMGTTPSATTLAYLGKTASNWNTTNTNGQVVIPLYTDQITTASLPNANSFGNYQITVAFGSATALAGVNFNPYPAVTWQDNNVWGKLPMSNVQVRTGPDLALHPSDYTTTVSPIAGQKFTVYAIIYNQGQTTATGVPIAAFLDGNRSDQVALMTGLTVAAGSSLNVTLNVTAITTSGAHTLELIVNPDFTINEGGAAQLNNNFANITVNVLPPPQGNVAISAPTVGLDVNPGNTILVKGVVRDQSLNAISGVPLTIELLSSTNAVIASASTTSDTNGYFTATLTVPSGTADGTYTVSVASTLTTIQSDSTTVSVRTPASFLNTPVPLLGIAWWLFLIILAIIVAAAVGITLYFKVYGLGKMVECGECGAFIPEDATVCPKCGVEFEKDMAKCSNCQAWIPVDVKQCPECGVEFATGQLDMADYQQKMRLQYDEVVQKFKEDASRSLGRALSEQEFQEWWRKQPTFLTFEDWLHEEEEMRKEGSRACPICGTLNSVTAKVCHKCGSLMKAAPANKPGVVKVGAPKRVAKPVAAPAQAGEEAAAPPVPESGPIVQKRIVKRTPGEGEQAEDEDQGDQGV